MDSEHQQRMELLSDISIVQDLLTKVAPWATGGGKHQEFHDKLFRIREDLIEQFLREGDQREDDHE